ncbi:MAG: sigma-70 family RNA polymerase sigma factor [Actinobacteria bacterium]|nr:sigma-70 family RNA polymerase sigma factor [Actinomycetota bacterium]MCG2817487.1 sigma-70 family RNA polymerase sigma factor [Actinomycetes bacterium]MBU4217971.1 sigma-70 family RNA polymerase sigma factor [Actinomycetota bacterium]MBU4357915.1 sigma-70 family RNA polymerase sigma factor [Actinomycetota bacterium]MBU4393034.1 sigma-70 family RNA polymerase sigma factor [Actinomycetota bacterium]
MEKEIEYPSKDDLLGDPGTLVKVYDAFRPRIYAYVASRVNCREDAEDLTSRTFEKALRNLGSYEPEKSSMATWLYRIAGNLLIDHYRRESTRKKVDMESLMRIYEGDTTIPRDTRRLELVTGVMRDLPEPQERVLTLKYLRGLSNDELADVLGCSKKTLSVKIYRALKSLKKRLDASDLELDADDE